MNLKKLLVKATVNKKNGQINICLPKKKMSKGIISNAYSGKPIKLLFEDFD